MLKLPRPLEPKPRILFKPTAKRPWRKSKMTIAAGFVSSEGIVLCADTQEVVSGYTKNSTEKIRLWFDQGLTIATTGAGDTELIETVAEHIERSLYSGYSPKKLRLEHAVQEIIRVTIASSFEKYIAPYAQFPKDDRPWCDLLTVVSVSNEINNYDCLFRVSGTTVRLVERAECVGSGLLLAKSLIERFYHPFMDLDELMLAACYIMYQTKKWIDGCGGNTDLMVFSAKRNILAGLSGGEAEGMEKEFEKLVMVDHLLFELLNPNFLPEDVEDAISRVRSEASKACGRLYRDGAPLRELFRKLDSEAEV